MLGNEVVVRAVASEYRRKVLEHLLSSGASTYTELMRASGLEESSKFAYHLRRLVAAGLIKQGVDGKYRLTGKGRRVAVMLKEEELDPPTVLDTLSEFSKSCNVRRFVYGSVGVGVRLWYLVCGSIMTAASLLGMPAKLEVAGTTYYALLNPTVTALMVIAGVIALLIGLKLLSTEFPDASALQLVMMQRYTTFLLLRSTYLRTYLVTYLAAALTFVALVWLALTPYLGS